MKVHTAVRRLAAGLLAAAMPLAAAACGADSGEAADHTQALDAAALYGDALESNGDWNTVASVNGRELAIQLETMAVRVTDTATGAVWSTNPEDPEADPVAGSAGLEVLKSQFQLIYHDVSNNVGTLNSFHDSLEYDQAAAYPLENGVAVHYILGDQRRDEDDVPAKISDTRFHEAVLDKLSAEEAGEMQDFYRAYESEGFWILGPRGRSNIERVLELFDKAGYTAEDLQRDNLEFGETAAATEKLRFEVTLEYQLEDDGLTVSIPLENLRFSENYPIYQIRLLENLASAPMGTEGYLVLPDGSGALMRFDDANTDRNTVSLPVYDTNPSIRSKRSNVKEETASLPVYGIQSGDNALLAIIEENAAGATVEAYRSGRNNGRNAVYTVFDICSVDYVYIAGSETRSSVPVFNLGSLTGECRVRYRLLSGGEAGYVGMAQSYQEYLLERDGLPAPVQDEPAPLVIDTIGGVYGYKSFLGISYTGLKAATTFEESRWIAASLKENGVENLQLKLSGWFNNGYAHDFAESIRVDGELGGKQGLRELAAYCSEQGIGLYPDVELMQVYRGGSGFSASFDAAKYLDVTEVKLPELSPVDENLTLTGRVRENAFYLLAPSRYEGTFSKFLKNWNKLNLGSGLSLRSAGTLLYADYNSDALFERRDTQKLVEEQLAALEEGTGSLLFNGANDYALRYASLINGAPVDYSYYELEDEAIPFYQLVTHGYIPQTGSLLNKADDVQQAVLRCIEYGVGIQYQVTAQASSFLKSTEYDQLYRSCFDDLLPEILESYRQVSDALEGVAGARMIGHARMAEGVYKTSYDNGIAVYVNYGTSAQTVEGRSVPAEGYAVVKD